MNYNTGMKVFKYKFTKLTLGFIWAGIALSVAAFGVTLYNVIAGNYKNYANVVYPIIGYVAMFFVSVLLIVILTALIFSSYYAVGNNSFKTSFGIIKSKFNTDDVDSILLDRATNKLTVYFKDQNFIVIVINDELYEEFVTEIMLCNPQIEYTINSKENHPEGKSE